MKIIEIKWSCPKCGDHRLNIDEDLTFQLLLDTITSLHEYKNCLVQINNIAIYYQTHL